MGRISKTVPEARVCVSASAEVRRCGHGVADTVFAFRPIRQPANLQSGVTYSSSGMSGVDIRRAALDLGSALPKKLANKNSRFKRAIFVTFTSFGQTASHSYSLEQFPKPSLSMASSMLSARFERSG